LGIQVHHIVIIPNETILTIWYVPFKDVLITKWHFEHLGLLMNALEGWLHFGLPPFDSHAFPTLCGNVFPFTKFMPCFELIVWFDFLKNFWLATFNVLKLAFSCQFWELVAYLKLKFQYFFIIENCQCPHGNYDTFFEVLMSNLSTLLLIWFHVSHIFICNF
jgi:hypothetical protein